MYNKNDLIELDVIDIASEFYGIAKAEGFTFFIKNALPQERVLCQVVKLGNKYGYAKVVKIINASKDRVQPLCPYYHKCGGCHCMHISNNLQNAYKRHIVVNTLNKYINSKTLSTDSIPSNISDKKCVDFDCIVEETIATSDIEYRNKVVLPVGILCDKVVVGFFRENSNDIVNIDNCAVSRQSSQAIQAIKEYITTTGDKPYFGKHIADNYAKINDYHDITGNISQGNIRHFVLQVIDNKAMIVVVTNSGKLKDKDRFVSICQQYFDSPIIYINHNSTKGNVILGDVYTHISGVEAIESNILGLKYDLKPGAFFQVNYTIAKQIYQRILATIKLHNINVVIDAYSGIGILSGFIAKNNISDTGNKNTEVIAIEIEQRAVDCAAKIKKLNNISTLENICGDTKNILPRILQKKVLNKDNNVCVILDPPRKGCDNKTISTINVCGPKLIIYISCNPATLARDVELLKDRYNVLTVTPYDMFRYTKHIELLTILTLK